MFFARFARWGLTFGAGIVLVVTAPRDAPAQTGAHRLLDVPYVAQTPELCGGAALAMVLRYWGERQVFAQDFESLVVASERGIPTGALVKAVRDRAWRAIELPTDATGTRSRVRQAIDRGQPLVGLIEVGPRTYHYVVIVGATENEVVLHDPARSPFRVLPWDEFERASEAAGRWMMLVLPPDALPAVQPLDAPSLVPVPPPPTSGSPCQAMVDRGVALFVGGDVQAAEELLLAATRVCSSSPAAWLELAGVRFSQSRWPEAAALAEQALRLAPDESHARELLATSRYLAGDRRGALDAWTPSGQPRIDAIDILGVARTRHPVVVEATGLQPRELLTSALLARAERRVRALPVAADARVTYEPLDDGLAKVEVTVIERTPFPRGWMTFGILGARAVAARDMKVEAAGLLGAGERLTVGGRWRKERPRAAIGLAFPAPSWLPGVVTFEGLWERQSYADARETRKRVALQLSDWATRGLRWTAGLTLDRFEERQYSAVEVGADLRLADDRLALAGSGTAWTPTDGGSGFTSASALALWRSAPAPSRGAWSAITTVTRVGQRAPRAVWDGAGTGSGRTGLLRAHPLLDDQVLTGPVFGRTVARGSVEYSQPIWRPMGGTLSIAGFIDAARAWRRASGAGPTPLYVDAGIGVRVLAPGRSEGLRVDLARGLRGGGVTLSVGVTAPWPR